MKLRNVSASPDERAIMPSSGSMIHVALAYIAPRKTETGTPTSCKCTKPHESAHRHITPSRFDSYIHREIARCSREPEKSRLFEGTRVWSGSMCGNAYVSRLPLVATSCIHHGQKVMEHTHGTLGHLRRRETVILTDCQLPW